MLKKIEHIGIAVKNLKDAELIMNKLFAKNPYKLESVDSEGVNTSFYQMGESKIELLEATNSSSAIHNFIEKKGEGIHHIAFEVDNIETETSRLKNEGFIFIYEKAKKGADNKMVNFIHPKSTNGILVELCQEIQV
jgi:methylmalonyl-CoA/ethylmalonyl-CoA epimerase